MPLFQKPPSTPEEIIASEPLAIPPEEVMNFNEKEWYARAYRGENAPQLTFRATAMGTLLGLLLSFTNIYIGLKTGWLLGVALTACILSFTIWTTMQRLGIAKSPMTILESNCMQSTASAAGYSTGNTLISAIPAMLLLTVSPETPGGVQLPVLAIAGWVFFLAILGVCIAIPMKRNLINQDRLKFPSGVAAAVTLQGFYSHAREALIKGRALFAAGAVGLLIPILRDLEIRKSVTAAGKTIFEGLIPSTTKIFDFLPKLRAGGKTFAWSDFNMKLDNSGVLVAAGAIIGLRVTISMVVSGLILAFYVTPMALEWTWLSPAGHVVAAATRPSSAWKEIGIWIGGPLMVSSGLLSFAFQWRSIARAFGSFAMFGRKKSSAEALELEATIARTEPPFRWFAIGVAVGGTGIVVLAARFFEVPFLYGVLAVAMTFALALVACRVTGETDITPGSALGKIMQLTYGILIPQSTTANLMTAGITSGAGLASADLLNDLKSGYLLGANPRRQFIAQAMGIFTGTVGSVLGYFLLVPNASALIGTDGADAKFPAPSAQAWKAVAEVFKLGLSNFHPMAQRCIFIGLVAGAALALIEYALPRYRRFLPSASGIGLGFILPFYNPMAMFLGALIAFIVERANKKMGDRFIIPVSAGLIAGEGIMGVIVAALNNLVLHS